MIDSGRKTMQRLTKIEANLRELRMKYVIATSHDRSMDEDGGDDLESEMEIAVEDLFFTQQHHHETFVHSLKAGFTEDYVTTKFKSTGIMAKED